MILWLPNVEAAIARLMATGKTRSEAVAAVIAANVARKGEGK